MDFAENTKKIIGLLKLKLYATENRCENAIQRESSTSPFTDKECADQNLPFSEFCPRCIKVWSEASVLDGKTPEEAIASVSKTKENANAN